MPGMANPRVRQIYILRFDPQIHYRLIEFHKQCCDGLCERR